MTQRATLRNMSADTKSSRRISVPVACLFAANAVAQFTIQAMLAYGFGAKVWKLDDPLPFAVPVALDIFAITLMVFAYQLREAQLRQRIYVWFWLGVAIACQVGAAEAFADAKDWGGPGRTASLFPSVFLAATLHGLIINARKHEDLNRGTTSLGWLAHWRTARGVAREIKAERLAAAATPRQVLVNPRVAIAVAHQVVTAESLPDLPPPVPAPAPQSPARTRPAPTRKALPAVRGRRPNPLKDILIKRCTVGGEDVAPVAQELGVGVRTAQLWVKTARAATASDHAEAGEHP